jgi:hypothetical protein
LSGTEDFLDGAREFTGKGLVTHGTGDFNDIVQGDVATVLDVLFLLTIPWGFLQGLDDQRRGRGHNGHLSLTVLDGQLDSDTETLPFLGTLGDIFTNLLGGKTERTDLGGFTMRNVSSMHMVIHLSNLPRALEAPTSPPTIERKRKRQWQLMSSMDVGIM